MQTCHDKAHNEHHSSGGLSTHRVYHGVWLSPDQAVGFISLSN